MDTDDLRRDKPILRLKDLRLVTELLIDALEQKRGARDRIATRYGIQKSVITDCVHRVESYFSVELFAGAARNVVTNAGWELAKGGPLVFDTLEALEHAVRDAATNVDVPPSD